MNEISNYVETLVRNKGWRQGHVAGILQKMLKAHKNEVIRNSNTGRANKII